MIKLNRPLRNRGKRHEILSDFKFSNLAVNECTRIKGTISRAIHQNSDVF